MKIVNSGTFRTAVVHPPSWHADRRQGLGGSSRGDLYNAPPYGCRLKLWNEKVGTPREFEPFAHPAQRGGLAMEPFIIKKVADHLGFQVMAQEPERVSNLPDWWLGNADGFLINDAGVVSILEMKVRGTKARLKMDNAGSPDDNIKWQVQQYMSLFGLKNAIVAILDRVSADVSWFFMEYDDKLHQEILREGSLFWAEVSTGIPPKRKLLAGDPRCNDCPFQNNCQKPPSRDTGEAIGDDGVADDLLRLQAIKEGVSGSRQEEKILITRMKEHMGEAEELVSQSTGLRITYTHQVREGLNKDKLRDEFPEAFNACRTEIAARAFRLGKL